MKRPITAAVLSILAGFAFSGSALAGSPDAGVKEYKPGVKVETPKFDEVNKDGDEFVSIQEARAAGVEESEAKSADLDSDGKLSPAEWAHVTAESDNDAGMDRGSSNMESGGSDVRENYKDKKNKSGTDKKVYD